MQLSRFSYYSDFVAYPILLVGLTMANFTHADWQGGLTARHAVGPWLYVVGGGFLLWTFFEYVLHRIALHRMPVFSPMHAAHHAAPLDFIGTPTWVSVPVLCGTILVPAWIFLGLNVADGLTVGVMLGYWWYGIVHHVIHHRAHEPSSAYFGALRAWHMRHHHSPKRGNFGVTTRIWDLVFGTAIRSRGKAAASP